MTNPPHPPPTGRKDENTCLAPTLGKSFLISKMRKFPSVCFRHTRYLRFFILNRFYVPKTQWQSKAMGSGVFSKAYPNALKPSLRNNFTPKHPLNIFRAQNLLTRMRRQLVQKFTPSQGGLHQADTAEHVRTRSEQLFRSGHCRNTSPSLWEMESQP